MKQARTILNTKEIADYFQVNPKTIRVWVKSGKLKELDFGYRTKRYDITNLL